MRTEPETVVWTRTGGHPDTPWLDRVRAALAWWETQPLEGGVTSSVTGLGAIAAAERRLAELHLGRRFLLTPNATYAVELALRAIGVGPGDDVLVPEVDWPASVGVIKLLGATPVPVRVTAESTIDAGAAKAAQTSGTKAVIASHYDGHLVDIELLREALPGLPVIEDAAAAFGRTLRGRAVGTLGDFSALSFGPGKAVDAGEAGALGMPNDAWLRVISLSAHPVRQAREGVPPDAAQPAMRPHPLAAVLVAHALRSSTV